MKLTSSLLHLVMLARLSSIAPLRIATKITNLSWFVLSYPLSIWPLNIWTEDKKEKKNNACKLNRSFVRLYQKMSFKISIVFLSFYNWWNMIFILIWYFFQCIIQLKINKSVSRLNAALTHIRTMVVINVESISNYSSSQAHFLIFSLHFILYF